MCEQVCDYFEWKSARGWCSFRRGWSLGVTLIGKISLLLPLWQQSVCVWVIPWDYLFELWAPISWALHYDISLLMAAPPESWCLKPCSNSDLETPYTSKNHSWREDDDRIDSRIRHFFKSLPWRVQSDDSTWVPLLNSDILAGGESLASSIGLRIFTERILSSPNNNSIPLSIMIPDCASSANKLPCVVYCHGGGMSHYSWWVCLLPAMHGFGL